MTTAKTKKPKRVRRKSGLHVDYDLPTDKELERMFDVVPLLEKHKFAMQVLEAGAEPIAVRARQLAPDGQATGNSRKRSKKQKAQARWNIPLKSTIQFVVRKYAIGGVAVVGPKHPEGNKAYFNTSTEGRRQVLWGKRTGRVIPMIRNWIVQAMDETRPQQLEAMKNKMIVLLEQFFLGKK